VNIEIKNWPDDPDFDPEESLAAAVAGFVGRSSLHEQVVVSSFHLPTIDRLRSLDPAIPTAWLVVGFDDVADGLATLVDHGHRILHPHHLAVTEELLDRCRSAGIRVNTWTLDDPDRMRELARWGIDGICTNVPDVARAALGSA
jgi:glycerophosphoryl diester phosphodiesterase